MHTKTALVFRQVQRLKVPNQGFRAVVNQWPGPPRTKCAFVGDRKSRQTARQVIGCTSLHPRVLFSRFARLSPVNCLSIAF